MRNYNIDFQYDENTGLHPPTRVVLKDRQGVLHTYVPQEECPPATTFKVGDIVKIIGYGLGHKGRRGVVIKVDVITQEFRFRVSFGDDERIYAAKSLEAA